MKITVEITIEEDVYGPWFVVRFPETSVTREVWHIDEAIHEIAAYVSDSLLTSDERS